MNRKTYRVPGFPDLGLITVPDHRGNAPAINDSTVDAVDGANALAFATKMVNEGMPIKEAKKSLEKAFGGADIAHDAIAAATGQRPTKKALDAGKIHQYRPFNSQESLFHLSAGEDAQRCLFCGEPFSIVASKCPRCHREYHG